MSSTGRPDPLRGEHRDPRPARRSGVDVGGASARCPFCGSEDTERISLFGSTLLVSQHYCRSCRTVFEKLKR